MTSMRRGRKPSSGRRGRLQRRRWRRRAALVTLVLVVTAVVVTTIPGEVVPPSSVQSLVFPVRPAQRRVNGPSLGLATSYQLTGPMGVAVDRGGDIYFTDGNRVYEVDRATGQLEVVAGTGATGFSGDGGPGSTGHPVRPERRRRRAERRRLFRRRQSCPQGLRCHRGHLAPWPATAASAPAETAARPSGPRLDFGGGSTAVGGLSDSIAVGPEGDLYLAEPANNEVQRVSLATGIITTVAGPGIHCAPLDGLCQTAYPSVCAGGCPRGQRLECLRHHRVWLRSRRGSPPQA